MSLRGWDVYSLVGGVYRLLLYIVCCSGMFCLVFLALQVDGDV